MKNSSRFPQGTKAFNIVEVGEPSERPLLSPPSQSPGIPFNLEVVSEVIPPLTHMIRNGRKVDQSGRVIKFRMFRTGETYKITKGRMTVKSTTDRAEADAAYSEIMSLKTGERKACKKKKNSRKRIVTVSGGLPS